MGRITVDIAGRTYCWSGGFASVLTSQEKNIKDDDVRYIAGELLYARNDSLARRFRMAVVNWIPCKNIDAEWIRTFKKRILDL